MTEEVKRCVDALREDLEWARANEWETPITLGDHLEEATNLIESLSAKLEQVTKAHDAAMKHLLERHKTICPICIHHTGAGCGKNANAGLDEAVIFCVDYEWCGFVR